MSTSSSTKTTTATTSIISAPVMTVEENKSISAFASTVVPYYGSRAPKQSILETDRVLFQMMDDIQITIQPELNEKEEKEWVTNQNKLIPSTIARNHSNILWKFRIVFSSLIILLLVVATVVISELTKERS